MKKYTALFLALALSAALSAPALAADITVDGTPVAQAQAVTMVPLRSTAEALGWSVTWEGSLPGARVDNGLSHIDVTLGVDLYQLISTNAIGASAPFSLGAAPAMLEKGTIYVPASLFAALLGNRENAVTIGADGTVAISAAQGGSAQIPNPLRTHETLEALKAAVGFDFSVPTPPAGFEEALYQDIAGQTAEIRWNDGVQEVTYRVSRGSSDNSGDYTVYAASGTLTVGDTAVQWRGRQAGSVAVALWTRDGYTCSVRASDGLTERQVRQMAESIL